MNERLELPTHCFDCGAILRASWTRHAPTCALVRDGVVKTDNSACRACGHSPTDHVEGACLICRCTMLL